MKKCVRCKQRKPITLRVDWVGWNRGDDNWVCLDCLQKELERVDKK